MSFFHTFDRSDFTLRMPLIKIKLLPPIYYLAKLLKDYRQFSI